MLAGVLAGVLAGDNASESTLADARCVVGLDFGSENMESLEKIKCCCLQRWSVLSHITTVVSRKKTKNYSGPYFTSF